MDTFYWILELCKVFAAYLLIMFAWPSILFSRFLKNRSFTFKFMFCSSISVFMINTAVMCLGLLHILNDVVFGVLFYGSILVSIYFKIPNKREKITDAGRVLAGSYGVKQMFFNLFRNSIDAWDKSKKGFKKKIYGHRIEYGLLAVVLLFGVIYFSYSSIQDHSYGFGDLYVHASWIYGLLQGKIFSAGIYPEGMHCFIYAMDVIFGLRYYNCVLFFGCVHVLIILVSVYTFLKEIFRSPYTPIFALALFLTIDVLSPAEVYGMSRFQRALPMEFGISYAFICATALIRYIRFGSVKSRTSAFLEKKGKNTKKLNKLIYNDELIIFTAALIDTIIAHFYATGMAFFLCLAIVPLAIHKFLNYKRFIPILACIASVLVLSIAPMAIAYASGIKLEKSIGWAMSIIEGDEKDVDENGNMVSVNGAPASNQTGQSQGPAPSSIGSELSLDEEDTAVPYVQNGGYEPQVSPRVPLSEKIKDKIHTLYETSYVLLYREDRARLIIGFTILAFIIFLICKTANIIYVIRSGDDSMRMSLFDGYFIVTFASVLFMILFSASDLGLPNLFSSSRLCGFERFLLCAVCVLPLDLLFLLADRVFPNIVVGVLGCVVALSFYVGTIYSGSFHGYLYTELTRYNPAVSVTESIISTMDPLSFTIVSPVDELYQTIEYGFHEELVQFINDCVEKDYTLPTEYVFVFYEKKPMKYYQLNFASGPAWIADEKYTNYFSRETASEYPNYITSVASPEIATGPFYKFPVSSGSYKDWMTRTVLESRMQKWVEDFNNLYPNELHTYYEDDYFVCYYFRQNPACLYQLGFEINDSRGQFITMPVALTDDDAVIDETETEEPETEEETEDSLQDAG